MDIYKWRDKMISRAVLMLILISITWVAVAALISFPACESENIDEYAAARMAVGGLQGVYPALVKQVEAGCDSNTIEDQFCKDFKEVINPTITDALGMLPKVIDAVERIREREPLPDGATIGIPEVPE